MSESEELDQILEEIKSMGKKRQEEENADSSEENAVPEESTLEQDTEKIVEPEPEEQEPEFELESQEVPASNQSEENEPKGEDDLNDYGEPEYPEQSFEGDSTFKAFADFDDAPASKASKKKKLITAVLIVLAVLLVIGGIIFTIENNKKDEPEIITTTTQTTTQATTVADVSTANPLTGEADFNKSAVGKRPIACVVENSYSARPQWGIDDEQNAPDIIVEGEVEGGETRMLWLYADYTSLPTQIGPMRSARPPYIKFSELFDSIFFCWGQSKTKRSSGYIGASTVFREDNVDYINQMKYTGSIKLFGRDSSRSVSSEHTGVLYGAQVASAIEEQGFRTEADESSYTKFSFNSEDKAVSDTTCNTLSLTFSSRTKTRDWTYNSEDKLYHSSDYQTDVTRKNLLVLYDSTEYITKANYKNSGSSETYCNYKLSGGKAQLASDGTVLDCTWSVEDGKLLVVDENGKEVSLNVGNTWIGYASSNNGGTATIG